VYESAGARSGFNASGIYRRLSPGVVTVISIFKPGPLTREGSGGLGSGFVLDGDGYLATNAHVVTTGQAPRLKRAREVFVEFADGNRVPAKILGEDPNSDVALIKVKPDGLSLTPLKVGRERGLRVGDPVAAIGSPFGEQQSLSVGVVSALNRNIQSLTAFQIGNAVQTDAAINKGNSGGPLLDRHGRVIGMNAQIRSESGGGEGVGYAIPADTLRHSLAELRRAGKVEYGYLGVTSAELYPQLARRLKVEATSGAVITEVVDDSPADDAGLEAGDDEFRFQGQELKTGGDVIVAVDGRSLTKRNDLADVISRKRPGEKVELAVIRGSKRRTVEVELEKRPNRGPRSLLEP
jgi:S1-C subfamily serine protease